MSSVPWAPEIIQHHSAWPTARPSCSDVVFLVHMLVCLHDAKITNQVKIFSEKVKPVVFSVMETKQPVDLTSIHFQSVVLEPWRNSLSFLILWDIFPPSLFLSPSHFFFFKKTHFTLFPSQVTNGYYRKFEM